MDEITNNVSIQFGKDISTGCSLRLNRTELYNLCCVGAGTCVGLHSSPYVSALGIPLFLTPLSGYIILIYMHIAYF